MIGTIKKRIETLNAASGYAVFPRRVVVIEEAGERHQLSERTVAILNDSTGVGVMFCASEGPTRNSLIENVTEVLSSDYRVTETSFGLLVTEKTEAADD